MGKVILTPLDTNPAGIVGLVEMSESCPVWNGSSALLSEFTPSLLKQWAEKILETFGDNPVYITVIASEHAKSRCLLATETPEETLAVGVAGWENEDVFKGVQK